MYLSEVLLKKTKDNTYIGKALFEATVTVKTKNSIVFIKHGDLSTKKFECIEK